jgi:F-type H+-transporting ATPase subunit b
MISINATLIIQIIHFLILLFILNRVLFRPILKLIRDREDYYENTKQSIVDIEQETERLRRELIERQMEARKEATKERSQLKAEGVSKAEKVMDASRTQGASLRSKADDEVHQELKRAQPFISDEAKRIAEEVMQNVIGRRTSV